MSPWFHRARLIGNLPGLRTARHSSGVRSSGYDVMLFLALAEDEDAKSALKKGMVIDVRAGLWGDGRGVAQNVDGLSLVGIERLKRRRKKRERMRAKWGLRCAEKPRTIYVFLK